MVFKKASIVASAIASWFCFRQAKFLDQALHMQYNFGDHLLTACKDINLNDLDLETHVDGCYHWTGHFKVLDSIQSENILPDMNTCKTMMMKQEVWQWQSHFANINDQQNHITSIDWRNADPEQDGSAYDPTTFDWPSSNPVDHAARSFKNDRKNLVFEPYNIKAGYVPVYFDGYKDYNPPWVNKLNKRKWEKVRNMAYQNTIDSMINYLGETPIDLANGTFYSVAEQEDIRLDDSYNTGLAMCFSKETANNDLVPSDQSNSVWEQTTNYGSLDHYVPCTMMPGDRTEGDYKVQSACQAGAKNRVRVIAQIRKVKDEETGEDILIAGYMEDHENFPHSFNSKPMAVTSFFAIGSADKMKSVVMGLEYGIPEDILKVKKLAWKIVAIVLACVPIVLFFIYYYDFDGHGELRVEDGKFKGRGRPQGTGQYAGVSKRHDISNA